MSRMHGAISPLPHNAFMAWRSVKVNLLINAEKSVFITETYEKLLFTLFVSKIKFITNTHTYSGLRISVTVSVQGDVRGVA
jgi:hypothetical protein